MSTIVQVRPGRQWQHCRVAPSALALMESARQGLAAAEDETTASARYVGAHLAALRAESAFAVAVVAALPMPVVRAACVAVLTTTVPEGNCVPCVPVAMAPEVLT